MITGLVLWHLCFVSQAMAKGAAGPGRLKMILNPGTGTGHAIEFDLDPENEKLQGAEEKPALASPVQEPQTVEPQAHEKIGEDTQAQSSKVVALPGPVRESAHRPSLTMAAGWRRDHLDWDIAGSVGSLPATSQLEWENLDSLGLSMNFKWNTPAKIYVKAGIDAGFIMNGTNRDSDYIGSLNGLEFSRSYADSNNGMLLDLTAGLGYAFDLALPGFGPGIRLIPMAGFSRHTQELEMTHGVQYLSDYGWTTSLGPFDGLDSSYDTRWQGPWAGLNLELLFPGERHKLSAGIEYHWVDYKAEANWNLRSDLSHPVSFRHDAKGTGWVLNVNYTTPVWNNWTLDLGAFYRIMEADNGSAIFYFSDGTTGFAGLNHVEWEALSVFTGLTYCF